MDYSAQDPMLEQRIEWIRTNFDLVKNVGGGLYVQVPEYLFFLKWYNPELYQETFPSDIFPNALTLVESLLEYEQREKML